MVTRFLGTDYSNLGFRAVPHSFDCYVIALQLVSGPVYGGIEHFEPRVSQDDSVTTQIGDIETQLNCFISLSDPEVAVLCDASGLIDCSINIIYL
jgi:hypothetical protein